MNGLPVKLRGNKPVKLKESSSNVQFSLTEAGKEIDLSSIPPRQRVARRLFTELHHTTVLSNLQAKKISPRASKLLQEWIQLKWVSAMPIPTPAITKAVKIPSLTAEQEIAVSAITTDIKQFNTWLLHGVTGSGKTEVYLRIIEHVLAHGKQALILIPEISLTPQLETVFRARFPTTHLVSLHSGLNDTERLTGWLQAQRGQARIILGTRLAVFTPLPVLGLVIVDEEQDSSFKQQDGLRYSARDLGNFSRQRK